MCVLLTWFSKQIFSSWKVFFFLAWLFDFVKDDYWLSENMNKYFETRQHQRLLSEFSISIGHCLILLLLEYYYCLSVMWISNRLTFISCLFCWTQSTAVTKDFFTSVQSQIAYFVMHFCVFCFVIDYLWLSWYAIGNCGADFEHWQCFAGCYFNVDVWNQFLYPVD